MTDRSERREDIKLYLEFAKLATSGLGLIVIALAVLQWQTANTNALQTVYQRMTNEWRAHLTMFVERPNLRPYFADSAVLPVADADRQSVLAMADVRLDVMDATLTYARIQGLSKEIAGWENTFSAAFRQSVVLCDRLRATQTEYGLIVPIADKSCEFKR